MPTALLYYEPRLQLETTLVQLQRVREATRQESIVFRKHFEAVRQLYYNALDEDIERHNKWKLIDFECAKLDGRLKFIDYPSIAKKERKARKKEKSKETFNVLAALAKTMTDEEKEAFIQALEN